jgi:cellulose synthase (UDP-forming)
MPRPATSTAGLSRTSGDLVVVFDADHAPGTRLPARKPSDTFRGSEPLPGADAALLLPIPDPVERNLDTFKTMPAENEMFYGKIQKGLDRWNASFFCGSAAVLRREALEEVGGFSGITITEDCETALELHSRGWNSVYVDKPMIAGLQPETFELHRSAFALVPRHGADSSAQEPAAEGRV